ncbi:hypothetical protein AURDEDRAFT_164513 [Auricularia subglabra TFB-10046 SS5]|nr:hypothetical protein AURDEDRAFT_164513 [Auricularia subglabra TFB-10046 SS5]
MPLLPSLECIRLYFEEMFSAPSSAFTAPQLTHLIIRSAAPRELPLAALTTFADLCLPETRFPIWLGLENVSLYAENEDQTSDARRYYFACQKVDPTTWTFPTTFAMAQAVRSA